MPHMQANGRQLKDAIEMDVPQGSVRHSIFQVLHFQDNITFETTDMPHLQACTWSDSACVRSEDTSQQVGLEQERELE